MEKFLNRRLEQIGEGSTSQGRIASDESRTSKETQPLAFALEVNYPNPFNPATTIPFTMAEAGQVRIEVYDMLGRRVALLADQSYQSGRHQVSWDASAMASGVYLLRMTVDLQEGGQVRQFNRQVMLVK